MKSGVLGSPDQKREERALHSDGITHGDQSGNFSRNAALAGAGAAAGAGGAYAATRPSDNVTESTHTDRSFPLSGGAVAPQHGTDAVSSTRGTESTGLASGGSAPIGLASTSGNASNIKGLNTGTAGGVGASSGEDARAQLGLARHSVLDHNGHSHSFHGDPCEESSAEKTLGHVPGPHATVAANMLDPHVPGEFPTDDGLDPHGTHGASGFSSAAQPTATSSDHHYGRDAALVGGAGAAGLGAHEALKDKSSVAQQPSSSPYTGAGAGYPAPLGSHEALADRTLPTQQPAYSSTTQPGVTSSSGYPTSSQAEPSSTDHHYGRDAALAGGAGAAGIGAYAATRDHKEPSNLQQSQGSSTVDPSLSQASTSQPLTHSQSPQHVPGNPLTGAREPQSEHHYGRDAALVGGAGAAGYGANEYLKDRTSTDPVSTGASGSHAGFADSRTQPAVAGHTSTTSTTAAHNPAVLDKSDPRNQSDFNRAQQEPLAQNKEHHYGRDAALVGGAGAAGAAGYSALHNEREDTGPASKTVGPHKSNIANIVDPRVQPEPEKMKDHNTAGPWQSDTLNKVDPKVTSDPSKADVKAHGYATGVAPQSLQQQQQQPLAGQEKEHHYGRDAAILGGTGAAGYGASQAYDKHEQEKLAREQEKQGKEHHYGRDAAVVGGTGAAGYGATQAYDKHEKPLQQQQQQPLASQEKEHHYGRDAAVLGGTGAAGYGATQAYDKHETPVQQQQQQAPVDQEKEHHYGRDAAVVGGAGAAGYGASQAYDKHEQEKLPKEQEKQAQHDAKERAKEQEKQAKHDAKEAEKAHKKEEKEHAKEQEKLEKHQAKENEKAEEKRLKEQEKAEKERLKEQEKADKERQKEQEKLAKEKEKEDAKLAAARHDEAEAKHNKLHKPAPEEREKGGIFHRIFHNKHYEREGSEGARESGSFEGERPGEGRHAGTAATAGGVAGAGAGAGALGHEAVPSSSAGQTAHTGESALGKSSFEQPGMGGEGDGMVTEPTTGLPMNVGKYGYGTGGTDANEAIAGHYKQ